MIDLFGLKKQPSDAPSADGAPEPVPEIPRGSHRLWAFLLILDSVFVIVFGGAVAAKVYEYWKAPARPPVAVARRHPGNEPAKPPEPTKPAEPAKPVEPAKAPEPEKPAVEPEPKTANHADTPRPPKPSLLAHTPKPREAPKLADPVGTRPTAAPAPAASSGGVESRPKARAVEFKLRSADAKTVQLVGAFIVHGGRKDLTRKSDGTWALTLYLHPGQYRYFFSVDKKKVLDPDNPHSERGASLLTLP